MIVKNKINKNEECFIAILKLEGRELRTQEILEMTNKFPDLCSGCESGTHVISAGLKLKEKGIVERKIARGGFRWNLI